MGKTDETAVMAAMGVAEDIMKKERERIMEQRLKKMQKMPKQEMRFITMGYYLFDELIRYTAFDITAYVRRNRIKQYRPFTNATDMLWEEYDKRLESYLPVGWLEEARRRMMKMKPVVDEIRTLTMLAASAMFSNTADTGGHDRDFVCMAIWLLVLISAKKRVEERIEETRKRYNIYDGSGSEPSFPASYRATVEESIKPFTYDYKSWQVNIGIVANKFIFYDYNSLVGDIARL